MRIEDLVSLANAGFTKEEIIKLTAEGAAPDITIEQTKEPATTPASQTVDNTQQPNQPAIPAALEETIARMNAAITQMQQQAVMNSQQPAKLSTDDILASIINPPHYQK